MSEFHAVVMAGGSGTRFWPMSRMTRPKQMLPLLGPLPMVRETVERLVPVIPPERIWVVVTRFQAEQIARPLEILPPENIILEPLGRDTAACIGLAATFLDWRDPGAAFCCLPADHYIGDVPGFHKALLRGRDLALEGRLVTFGVPPTRPETGYGYLRAEGERVLRFCEKPDEERAREFLAAGDYYWNGGIFVWRAGDILEAIRRHLPAHAAGLETVGKALGTSRLPAVLEEEYRKFERISIDYGVMEKVENVAMVKADFGWDDVGSWVAAASHKPSDPDGNVLEGQTHAVDSEQCIVVSDDEHLVAAFGVQDLVIVHTGDATLVCPKEKAADLKKLVESMREKGLGKYL